MMNKNSIKLAFLLSLGISFQANSMYLYENEMQELEVEMLQQERIERDKKEKEDPKLIKQKRLNDDFVFALTKLDYNQFEQSILDGADVNVRIYKNGKFLGFPLHHLLQHLALPGSIKFLIYNGADINIKYDNKSVLWKAVDVYKNRLIYSGLSYSNGLDEYLNRIKLLLSHGASCIPIHSFIQSNNELRNIFTSIDQIDKLKNSPKLLVQQLKKLDEKHHLLQRVLMNMQSPKEFRLFIEELKEATKQELHEFLDKPIFLNADEFQESLIENYATPAIMYELMKKGIVSITEKRINAQPAKVRQLELQDIFNHNQMIVFKKNFDMKLNYK